MSAGELLLLYTDGVTEAMRSAKEIYGNKRLIDLVSRQSGSIDALVKAVVQDVEVFVEGRPQSDDICLVGFQRLA